MVAHRLRPLLVVTAVLVLALCGLPARAAAPGPAPSDATVSPMAVGTPDTVYRFYSPVFRGHFYTIDPVERDRVIATWPTIWTYEGARYSAYRTQEPGTVPLYRFWSESFHGHFYTADAAEKDRVIATWPTIWSFEGVAYYVYPPGSAVTDTVPVFRFWGPGVQHHFYTASALERDRVISWWPTVWSYERERFRVPRGDLPVEPVPAQPADRNCSDFATWADAQAFFGTYYAYYGDFANLDGNGDLIACQSLPGAPH